MKKIIVSLAALFCTVSMFAQMPHKPQNPQRQGDHRQMIEMMESEKIAYITQKLSLSPDEAKVFWPVYEQIKAEKAEQQKALRQARMAMSATLKPDAGKTEKEIAAATKAYVDALDKAQNIDSKYYKELVKVLPAEKVAKYYMAEEGFRQHQINRMKGSANGRKGNGVQKPVDKPVQKPVKK